MGSKANLRRQTRHGQTQEHISRGQRAKQDPKKNWTRVRVLNNFTDKLYDILNLIGLNRYG